MSLAAGHRDERQSGGISKVHARGSGLCSTTTLPFTPWYRGALNSPARGTTLSLVTGSANTTENEAPPLYPKVSQEEMERMSPEELDDYLNKGAQAAAARWGGRSALFLKENPAMDFRNPPAAEKK